MLSPDASLPTLRAATPDSLPVKQEGLLIVRKEDLKVNQAEA